MKKYRVVLAAISLLAMSSCAVNEIEDVVTPSPKPKQIIEIEAVEVADTRAIHGTEEGETSFSWQKGVDKIGVLLGYTDGVDEWWTTEHYRFTNTTDGQTALFTYDADPDVYSEQPALEVGQTIVAYYPYGTAVSSMYNTSKPYLRSSLGALLQKGDNTTEHLYHGDYMYSRPITLKASDFDTEGNVKLQMEFGHIFAKMRFTVKNSTSRTLDINSLVYRSTNVDDIMQGTLCLDATTGQLDLDNKGDWGGVPPSNSAVLEVEDVELAPGETATLWMWMMPLDFTEGNAAGRKADIMVNTSAGVFRVQNTNFNQRILPGAVYRQGFELTEAKLLADYAYVSDPNFVSALYFGNPDGDIYDENGNFIGSGSYTTLYDLELQPYPDFDGSDWDMFFTGGCYIKISEAAKLTAMNIAGVNALSLDGLQYFTGLKVLDVNLGVDVNATMSLRALKFGTLTELESFFITMVMAPSIDFSANTKLQSIAIGQAPMLEKIVGLDKLTNLQSFSIGDPMTGFELDLSQCPTLKDVSIMSQSKTFGLLNLSNLALDHLMLDISNSSKLVSENLSCVKLENVGGQTFPSGAPSGVKELHLGQPYQVASMVTQFDQMTEIEKLNLSGDIPNVVFTPAQASVKELTIYCNEGTNLPSGWSNLKGVHTLIINKDSLVGKWCFDTLDLSGMTSLLDADILVKEIHSFVAPSSLKRLSLTIYNSLNFTPNAALEDLTINTVGSSIALGSGANLKNLYIIGSAGQGDSAISLGEYPLLESLTASVGSRGNISFGAASYPSLKSYHLSDGSNVTTIPSSSVFPNLEKLNISDDTGISSLNLVDYSKLKNLRVYESKFGSGAISISRAQCNYAQANDDTFTGITASTVSSIYKVVE